MKIKTYKVEFYQDENGVIHCIRENNGFNAFMILEASMIYWIK